MKSVAFLLGLAVLLVAVQFVVFPRHDRDQLWSDYESLPPGSVDVLFLGTSLVHANINPTVIWKTTGIRTYNLSGSEQSLYTTPHYLDQALRTQKPDVVVLETHMFSGRNLPLNENQKRSNFTMMPLGLPKLKAIVDGAPAAEWTSYLIPLEQFHSRWAEIGREDFHPDKWRQGRDDFFLGYRQVNKVEPQAPDSQRREFDAELYAQNYKLVSKVIESAESAGAKVLLLSGPSSRIHLHDKWIARLSQDVTRDYPDVRFLETQLRAEEIGLDYAADYYDQLHLNSGGAEKFSLWLGLRLGEMYELPRRHETGQYAEGPWRAGFARYADATRKDRSGRESLQLPALESRKSERGASE